MNTLKSLLTGDDHVPRAFLWGGVAVGVTLGVACIYKLTRTRTYLTPDAAHNTVILHQLTRGPYTPNMVPFAIKLETYLRMAKIPYKIIPGFQKSPKGKLPWIEYNGEIVSDSSFCIQYLNQKLDLDLNQQLTPADLGVARALQRLVEEHLYWIYVSFPWVTEPENNLFPRLFKMNPFFKWMIEREMKNRALVQGIGRHNKGEVTQKLEEDLQALSDLLGPKKFFFGDKATEADCPIFGQLAVLRWNLPGHTTREIFCKKFPKLCEYCDRMKAAYWPEWDECITHGGTRKATK